MQDQPQQVPPVPPAEPGVVPNTSLPPVPTPVEPPVPTQSPQPAVVPVEMSTQPDSTPPVIEWQASEYVTREKNTVWYVALGAITIILALVAYFVIKDITFVILVIVMAVAVGLFARRPARDMAYSLSYRGLSINGKFFDFQQYRAFGVVQEGALYSITLLPRKRFAPSVNVYFPPEYGERIVDMFGAALPMEHVQQDFIDRLSEKLRF